MHSGGESGRCNSLSLPRSTGTTSKSILECVHEETPRLHIYIWWEQKPLFCFNRLVAAYCTSRTRITWSAERQIKKPARRCKTNKSQIRAHVYQEKVETESDD